MVIDIHAHQYPDIFRNEFKRLVELGIMPPPAYNLERWDIESHLNLNDSFGIDLQILSITLQTYPPDPDAARDLTQAGNDGLAEVCRRPPDRFAAFAALPLLDVEASIQELRRGVTDLEMKGVILGTNVRGRALDDEDFLPIWEEIDRLRLPVLLHPLDPGGPSQAYAHRLELWIGWPVDTAYAAARLIMNGILDKFPNLTIILSHLGGATHYLLERICEGIRNSAAKRPGIDYYRNMYHDTAGPVSSSAMLCANDLFGAERIVYGTDYPFGEGQGRDFIERAFSCVKEISLPSEEEKMIFETNAKKILGMTK